MTSPQKYVGRKAAKATLRHTVRGTTSKARRDPPRTLALLGAGILIGAIVGLIVGRRAGAAADPFPNYEPPVPSATHSTSEAKAAAAA